MSQEEYDDELSIGEALQKAKMGSDRYEKAIGDRKKQKTFIIGKTSELTNFTPVILEQAEKLLDIFFKKGDSTLSLSSLEGVIETKEPTIIHTVAALNRAVHESFKRQLKKLKLDDPSLDEKFYTEHEYVAIKGYKSAGFKIDKEKNEASFESKDQKAVVLDNVRWISRKVIKEILSEMKNEVQTARNELYSEPGSAAVRSGDLWQKIVRSGRELGYDDPPGNNPAQFIRG